MKKLTAIILAMLLACTAVVGCDKDAPQGESTETESPQQSSTETERVPNDYDRLETQQGFSLKGQKYPYQNNDVLILDVENTTDTNYTATLAVTFYDESGEALKIQKKTVEQFPSGYKQACLFDPHLQFSSYTCEISLNEYTGPDYFSTVKYNTTATVRRFDDWLPGTDQRLLAGEDDVDLTYYPTLLIGYSGSFGPSTVLPEGKKLWIRCDVIVFDNTGKLYQIYRDCGALFFGNTDTTITDGNDIQIHQSTEPNWKWPKELEGEVRIIVIPIRYELKNAYPSFIND